MSDLNEYGSEVFDQTPVSYPINFERPEPLHMRIRRMIIQAMDEMQRPNEEFETIDEANDFDMPEVDEMDSPYYEPDYDLLVTPKGGAGGETPPDKATDSNELPPQSAETPKTE